MSVANTPGRLRDWLVAGSPLLLALALGVFPLLTLFVESIGPGLGGENYAEVLSPLYRGALLYSIGVGVGVTAVCLAVAYPITYWIAHRCPDRYRLIALVSVTLPLWLNYVVLNYAWVWILARGGVVNRILVGTGLLDSSLDLLYNNISMGIGFVYIYLPYVVLTMYVSMERLDYQLIEAARDLGASDVRVFLDIVLPRTLPGAAAATLIVYARIAGAFATPEILGSPGNVMIARLVVQAFRQYTNYGFAAALSFVFLLLVLGTLGLGALSPRVRRELRQW
ncbi:spermidine/putrescine transport system permease protein [Haloarcula quadrata]|jgi:spermidine/putrescine transport system permease protein|uniref:ABC transporter permease n=3 Tax=Haloarcula TaxID=2237 RepID=M0K3H2_9EURY|nr:MULTISPECIES: ABC transporter permease [Haloarcula]EMA14400.1 spermidine/putrescine ABC transporter permease [Haloarcula sinaiiensis ATCC 33800]EMA25551.1 spermidine/putrescine ABC transporter permease [Haloarcula californiae ATCC 33799]NHN63937.1 ABC transporter permease [Haloarcula sp. JP-Z28]NHX39666.1 ABC transporter permease [Haloarcula sp. R1-2]QUJ71605.1 ABC transporter permease [Haloarcula sinaiiensis ATCC 33800]